MKYYFKNWMYWQKRKNKWWLNMPMKYWHAYPEDMLISGKINALDWTWWL